MQACGGWVWPAVTIIGRLQILPLTGDGKELLIAIGTPVARCPPGTCQVKERSP